jgi:uncharacterized Zn-finger protein
MKITSNVTQVKPGVKEVACDGGGGALGHPMVYLPFGKKSQVECYYCGKRFEKTLTK